MSEIKEVNSALTVKNVKENMQKKVIERLHAQISDSKMYLEAATSMDERDGTDVTMVAGLYEMAKDEYSHAYFLKKYLDDHNVDVPETCEKSFKDLEIQIKKVFR